MMLNDMATIGFLKDLPLGQGVTHLAVTSCDDVTKTQLSEGMNVFWRGDRPIGHVLVHVGAKVASKIGHIEPAFLDRIEVELRKSAKPTLSASVVICTRDRPAELSVCLSSLPRQTYPPREIIVVDNASLDRRTQDIALSAGAIYIREDRPGLDIARNTGALRATSDIVAYTDDDVLLHPQWLERLVTAFDTPQIGAVTGLVLPAEIATEAQRHFETYWGFGKGYELQDFDTAHFKSHRDGVFPAWDIGAGASMAFRREVFETVGYFDERLDVGQAGCSGDSEFWYRLLANGHTCRYFPGSVAFHFHRKTIEGLASQIYYYMRGHVAALLVQYERTGIAANRYKAYWHMPRWYLRRFLGNMLRRSGSMYNRFLKEEIAGYFAGLSFYHRRRNGR